MSLAGRWRNEYGSVMQLAAAAGGLFLGDYASQTGHTGRYLVCGRMGRGWSPDGDGAPVSLALFWRSLEGDPDPSWHWVSGFGGKLIRCSAGAELSLTHVLLTTAPSPLVAETGAYIDKLRFVAEGGAPSAPAELEQPVAPAAGDPCEGEWCGEGAGAPRLRLQGASAATGLVRGTLELPAGSADVVGFTDIAASGERLPVQAIALTALLDNRAIQLVGSLDLGTRTLAVCVLTSRATPPDQRYLSTTMKEWRLRPR